MLFPSFVFASVYKNVSTNEFSFEYSQLYNMFCVRFMKNEISASLDIKKLLYRSEL